MIFQSGSFKFTVFHASISSAMLIKGLSGQPWPARRSSVQCVLTDV